MALAEEVAQNAMIMGRKFGFQRGLAPTTTLIVLNAVVKGGHRRITTLDLTKAYDRVKRSTLLHDCNKSLNRNLVDMLKACLQTLTVTTKGDVMGKEAQIILGLTQGAPLSLVLCLIYINDIADHCPRQLETTVTTNSVGKAEITLTADDVVVHAADWESMQVWLDACKNWAKEKGMKWEATKCTVICS